MGGIATHIFGSAHIVFGNATHGGNTGRLLRSLFFGVDPLCISFIIIIPPLPLQYCKDRFDSLSAEGWHSIVVIDPCLPRSWVLPRGLCN